MKQSRFVSTFVVSALFLLGSCAGTSNTTTGTTGAAAMNAKCPVSGESLEANCPTTNVDGKTVGFCCNKCMTKFQGMSAADQKAKLTGSMPMK